jgi:hypothetical protein
MDVPEPTNQLCMYIIVGVKRSQIDILFPRLLLDTGKYKSCILRIRAWFQVEITEYICIWKNAICRCPGAEDVSSASETEDPGSNPARV